MDGKIQKQILHQKCKINLNLTIKALTDARFSGFFLLQLLVTVFIYLYTYT